MKHKTLFLGLMTCCLATPALADYTLTPTSGGMNAATVPWGGALVLDLELASDAGDVHDSAIFRMVLTEPGLIYDSYDWTIPYTEAGLFDDSEPGLADLPLAIEDDTLSGAGYPSGVADIELSNVLIGSTFGEGTLVSMELTIPADYGFVGSLFIFAFPDTFAHGFSPPIPTTGGQVFELTVTPEPATGALVCLVLLRALRRPRR